MELIDERSKEYSQAGDDKVTQAITGELICTLFYYIINQAKRGGGGHPPRCSPTNSKSVPELINWRRKRLNFFNFPHKYKGVAFYFDTTLGCVKGVY